MGFKFKGAIRKVVEQMQKQKQAAAAEQQKPATPPQQTAKRSGGFRGLGQAIRSAAEKAKQARSSTSAKPVGEAIALGALGGRRLSERLKGKKGFGGFMGKAIGAAAQRAKMKREEEEGTKPTPFKKGGAVKKGRGMGAATRGGGACAPRKPRKMMGGGSACK